MPGAAWFRASATMPKRAGSARDISSAVCRLASKAILRATSDCSASCSDCSRSTRSACRVRTAMTMPAMAAPMAMDHSRSTRARFAAACACSAVVVTRFVTVVCAAASVASRLV